MTRLGFVALVPMVLVPGALAGGCGESHGVGTDSGPDAPLTVMFDAGPPRPDAWTPPPVCGDSTLDPGEQCDDGNTAAGDGCDAVCHLEAFCGDRVVNGSEVCDDGNHFSNDGCRADCMSNETCGNGIVDVAAGEICDGSAGCAADCLSLTGCGDMTVTAPEECDDGNTARWDGCGPDCREEISVVLQNLQFADRTQGCDYSGDGNPDNGFAVALGPGVFAINMLLAGGGGTPTFLGAFLGLDDPAGVNDPDLRVGWLTGTAGTMPNTYLVNAASLAGDLPAASLQGHIVMTALDAGPESIDLPLGFFPLTLHDAFVRGTTAATAGRLSRIDAGTLCGVVGPEVLTVISADLLNMIGGGMVMIGPPCDGSMQPATLFDVLVGGARVLGLRIGGVGPDVDLDHDGLESFVLTSTGPAGCQPVITACIDGDGTRIDGRNCVDATLPLPGSPARFQDGYSAALTYDALRTTIVGIAP